MPLGGGSARIVPGAWVVFNLRPVFEENPFFWTNPDLYAISPKMQHYHIKVTHPDGTEDWVGQIYFNGKLDTTREREHAVIFDKRFAEAFVETIEAEGCRFEMIEVPVRIY